MSNTDIKTPDVEDPLTTKANRQEKFSEVKMFIGDAVSFGELEEQQRVSEFFLKVDDSVWALMLMNENVMRRGDVEDKEKAIKDLAAEYNALVQGLNADDAEFDPETRATEINEKDDKAQDVLNNGAVVKQKGNASILKTNTGELFFYGVFTNSYLDDESEVLTEKAHEEFTNYLDFYPEMSPELWVFHIDGTAFSGKASWITFHDNQMHGLWPVTEDEAKQISLFMDQYEPGMSHGFYPLERDVKDTWKITKYRTFEASILPLEYAANKLTDFTLFSKDAEKMTQFLPQQREVLEAMEFPEELIAEMESKSTERMKAADGPSYKANDSEETETDETEETEETEETTETDDTAPTDNDDNTDDDSVPLTGTFEVNDAGDIVISASEFAEFQKQTLALMQDVKDQNLRLLEENSELKSKVNVDNIRSQPKGRLLDVLLSEGKSIIGNPLAEADENEDGEQATKGKPEENEDSKKRLSTFAIDERRNGN